jgi:pyruvate dehydrogenase E2 component (dihydrolipoamide acetyltransferase)
VRDTPVAGRGAGLSASNGHGDKTAAVVDVRLPGLPDCWDSCGNCSDGELTVVEVLVAPGDEVGPDDPVLVLETDKTTLDIPADRAGRVIELQVAVGDRVSEGQLLLRLIPAAGRRSAGAAG